jgi:hypothetical protein
VVTGLSSGRLAVLQRRFNAAHYTFFHCELGLAWLVKKRGVDWGCGWVGSCLLELEVSSVEQDELHLHLHKEAN